MAVEKDQPDKSILELRDAVGELHKCVAYVREHRDTWRMPEPSVSLPSEATGWNFTTFEKYISQRFGDLSLQLRERYEAQQTGVTAALAAAEKAVNAALIAAEKAVDKAERAQDLRNQVANEFRSSLSDLSGLMWTKTEGQEKVESLRRELTITQKSVETKVNLLETGAANIQGRIWGVSALWAIIAVAASVGVKFIG